MKKLTKHKQLEELGIWQSRQVEFDLPRGQRSSPTSTSWTMQAGSKSEISGTVKNQFSKLFVCITILTFLSCGTAYALPVGNPSDAGLLRNGLVCEGHYADPYDPCLTWLDVYSFRFGFYGDYVFNRHMEIEQDHNDDDIEKTEIFTNAGFIALNFWDRVDLFTTLGMSNIFIDTNNKAFGLGGSGRVELETDTHFSWSVGIRGVIWRCGCTEIGGEAQYFYTKPRVTRVTVNDTSSVYPNDVSALYHEWQIGVGITHRFPLFIPYLAVKWSRSQYKLDEAKISGLTIGESTLTATLYDLEGKKDWGYAAGVSFIVCDKASLTLEGRFTDEKAVYINGQVRF